MDTAHKIADAKARAERVRLATEWLARCTGLIPAVRVPVKQPIPRG